MSLDAWLAASGATSDVVWRQFDLLAGRRLWLSCSEPAAVRRKSRPVHRRAWRYSSPIWKRRYCKPLSEPSRQLAECAHDAGRVCGSCTPSLPSWRDSRTAGVNRSLHFVIVHTCTVNRLKRLLQIHEILKQLKIQTITVRNVCSKNGCLHWCGILTTFTSTKYSKSSAIEQKQALCLL